MRRVDAGHAVAVHHIPFIHFLQRFLVHAAGDVAVLDLHVHHRKRAHRRIRVAVEVHVAVQRAILDSNPRRYLAGNCPVREINRRALQLIRTGLAHGIPEMQLHAAAQRGIYAAHAAVAKRYFRLRIVQRAILDLPQRAFVFARPVRLHAGVASAAGNGQVLQLRAAAQVHDGQTAAVGGHELHPAVAHDLRIGRNHGVALSVQLGIDVVGTLVYIDDLFTLVVLQRAQAVGEGFELPSCAHFIHARLFCCTVQYIDALHLAAPGDGQAVSVFDLLRADQVVVHHRRARAKLPGE